MTEKRLARFNLIAVFDDIDRALGAVEMLSAAGLDIDELSLLGPEHQMRPGSGEVEEEPATPMSGVGSDAVKGIGVGGVAGVALGALAGAVATAIPGLGLALGAGAIYGAIAGGMTGHVAGGVLGLQTGARKSMMWEQTLHPLISFVEEGYVLVGVHSEDEGRVDLAEGRMRELQPRDLRRFEADESFIPPGDVSALAGRSVPSSHPEHPGGELGRDQVGDEGRLLGMELRGEDREADPGLPEPR